MQFIWHVIAEDWLKALMLLFKSYLCVLDGMQRLWIILHMLHIVMTLHMVSWLHCIIMQILDSDVSYVDDYLAFWSLKKPNRLQTEPHVFDLDVHWHTHKWV